MRRIALMTLVTLLLCSLGTGAVASDTDGLVVGALIGGALVAGEVGLIDLPETEFGLVHSHSFKTGDDSQALTLDWHVGSLKGVHGYLDLLLPERLIDSDGSDDWDWGLGLSIEIKDIVKRLKVGVGLRDKLSDPCVYVTVRLN